MSTPEQPATPALTRKQMRDIRNTGATAVISDDAGDDASPEDDSFEDAEHSAAGHEQPAAAHAPLPRAAEPVSVHDFPGSDASVDLGVTPLTRRQARQQERIRTASVAVISPEAAAAHASALDRTAPADQGSANAPHEADAGSGDDESTPRPVLNPQFGAGLLAGAGAHAGMPPSFDQLIARSATGSIGTGNALILSQTPTAPNLVAPVASTGEVLITGTFNLADGIASTGHATGTADGKDVDSALIDGELPAHSSPTPIAASAAISTAKNGGDIIKPPVPDKGGRLMLTLAITAGALALALVGVLILAFVTGVF